MMSQGQSFLLVFLTLTYREAASFETDLDSVNNSGLLFQKKGQFYEMRSLSISNACSVLDKALEGLSNLLQEFRSDGSNAQNPILSVHGLALDRGKALKKVEHGKFEVIFESSMVCLIHLVNLNFPV